MSKISQMSAMERVKALLDEGSFVEIGADVTKRSTDFNLQEKSAPSDGVITGYGLIDGKPAYVYSQDASVLGGSIGEMHARKITRVYDLAMKSGAPVVGLVDCAGLRLQEATDALAGFGEIYRMQAMASGAILQVCAILGSCGGGVAVSQGLCDFTFVEANSGRLFVSSPNAIEGNYIEKCDTSLPSFQSECGAADFVAEGEEELFRRMRLLISMLPSNSWGDGVVTECRDDLNRMIPGFEGCVADPARALAALADGQEFVEVKEGHAKDMVVGFLRLNGATVGAVANRSSLLGEDGKEAAHFEGLSCDGCRKAADFVSFCDSFRIPVVTLANVAGYRASMEEERGIAREAAGLIRAYATAEVPKVTVITGKAFGSAYVAMGSKHVGADIVFALPDAKIGMMDAESAVKIMYADELREADKKGEFLAARSAEYEKLQGSAKSAASRGYVDGIIDPSETRKHLIYALEMLCTKKGHGCASKGRKR